MNGPGEALVSALGVNVGHKKSGFYENGVRQKERLDNHQIVAQHEARIRLRGSAIEAGRIQVLLLN